MFISAAQRSCRDVSATGSARKHSSLYGKLSCRYCRPCRVFFAKRCRLETLGKSLAGLPQLAEAAPTRFLEAVDAALNKGETSPLKEVFGAYETSIFGRNYHSGLLWALEVLAWSPDYLSGVCVALARMAQFPLPQNAGNNASATLRSIFLTWMPQTLASVDARRAAVERVIEENPEVGWKLLMGVLPEGHQVGSYNQKPAWRDWFPSDWSEGVTRSEMHKQVRNYAEVAVRLAMDDILKLKDVIGRWDHLPREVFQQVLDYLESARALERSAEDRFETLANA